MPRAQVTPRPPNLADSRLAAFGKTGLETRRDIFRDCHGDPDRVISDA